MTRVLTFDGPKAARRFDLLLTAVLGGGDGKGERSPMTIRKEARLQDEFDRISEPHAAVNGTPVGEADRQLKVGGDTAVLVLQQEDFELLQQYTEKTPWTPRVSRDVVDLWDWLSAAERRD